MNKKALIFLPLVSIIVLACLPPHARAETVTITRSYTYTASPFDSRESSAVIAFAKLRLIIFNAVASRVSTIEEAAVLAPAVVPVQEGRQSWDGTDYEVEASVSIDPEGLFSALKALEADPHRAAEIRELRRREAEAMSRMEIIKKEEDLRQYMRYDALVLELAAADAMERGYSALSARGYSAAEKYFTTAVELNPDDAAAYFNRGAANWLLENFGKAVADFRKALELKPGYERAEKSLAQAEEYFSNVRKRIDYYDRAIAVNPAEVGLYYERGLANWEMGNYGEAVRDFTMVIRLSPNVEDGFINRGGVYLAVGEYEAALADFESAIRINPGSSVAHFNLGLAHIRLKSFEDAIRSFGRVIEINPSDVEALFNRGALYEATGKSQKAVADMQSAARLGHRGAREFLAASGVSVVPGKAGQGKTEAKKEKIAEPAPAVAPPEKVPQPTPEEKVEEAVAEVPLVIEEPDTPAEASEPPKEEKVEVAELKETHTEEKASAEAEAPEPLPERAAEVPVSEKPEVSAAVPEKTEADAELEARKEDIQEKPREETPAMASIEEPESQREPEPQAEPAPEETAEESLEEPVIATLSSGPIYAAQVGAFSSLENADSYVVRLKKKGYPAYVRAIASQAGKQLFLVLIGRYSDRGKAERMAAAFIEHEKVDSLVTVVK